MLAPTTLPLPVPPGQPSPFGLELPSNVCGTCRGKGAFFVSGREAASSYWAECYDCRGDGRSDAGWAAEHAEEIAHLAQMGVFGESLQSGLERYGRLTPRQLAAVQRSIRRDRAEARTAPVVEGRGEITGEVMTVREQDTAYGWTVKMRVRDDRGFEVWGTMPKALVDAGAEEGARVAFVATVEASRDDETFGFFRRPATARLV